MSTWSIQFCIPAVFVRKNAKTGRAEIVLLDHGLYEFLPESIRLSLCQFWEAIVLKDINKMQKYSRELNVEGEMNTLSVHRRRW